MADDDTITTAPAATPATAPSRTIRAAGALLWRDGPEPGGPEAGGPEPGGPEIAVIHRPRYDDWSLPKGKLDAGEHVLRAAVREVEEETGIVPRLGRRLPTSTYTLGDRTKRVDWWAARPVADAAFVPNDEVDRIEWLPAERAAARLSYRHDAELLEEFLAAPLHTRPVVILRHAAAHAKEDWRDADELRPLDAAGRADAARLSPLLSSFGPVRLVSSATARCVETVLPHARRTRADVTTDGAFTVGDTAPGRAVERLLELVADGVPTVVCTHGEVVEELVTGLCRELGEKVPDDPCLRKGEFWVGHVAGEAMPALERHAPWISER
ncbi:NUDIX hydrolase [Actinomadura algeriensis]|uniref:8-oxo-dGTP diphosphatase n=1 Tax=Actinomadura algeriensis TaxID=1679523 RepID=A0ABR9JMZ3_9ACTN|nr:NUDIX hydrolase [Actinomadura algeriensis]MBE1531936.1 8-oxo-dGTP diphosphatase [Actinomadura algeriensis]